MSIETQQDGGNRDSALGGWSQGFTLVVYSALGPRAKRDIISIWARSTCGSWRVSYVDVADLKRRNKA